MVITTRNELRERLGKLDRDDLAGLFEVAGDIDLNSEISRYQIVIHGSSYHGSIDAAYAHVLISFQKQIDSLCGGGGSAAAHSSSSRCGTTARRFLARACKRPLRRRLEEW